MSLQRGKGNRRKRKENQRYNRGAGEIPQEWEGKVEEGKEGLEFHRRKDKYFDLIAKKREKDRGGRRGKRIGEEGEGKGKGEEGEGKGKGEEGEGKGKGEGEREGRRRGKRESERKLVRTQMFHQKN